MEYGKPRQRYLAYSAPRELTKVLSVMKCALIEESDLLEEFGRGSHTKPLNGPGCRGPFGQEALPVLGNPGSF